MCVCVCVCGCECARAQVSVKETIGILDISPVCNPNIHPHLTFQNERKNEKSNLGIGGPENIFLSLVRDVVGSNPAGC